MSAQSPGMRFGTRGLGLDNCLRAASGSKTRSHDHRSETACGLLTFERQKWTPG